MAEPMIAERRPQLAGLNERLGAGLNLAVASPCARYVLRAKKPPARAAGFDLSMQINRFWRLGALAAARLGPDEFLLLSPKGAQVADGVAAAMGEEFYSLVDVGHRQIGLALEGAGVEEALNAGCPLDLALRAFPVGMATRTLLGKIEIVLMREGETRFHLECWRSFAPYAVDFLREAAVGL